MFCCMKVLMFNLKVNKKKKKILQTKVKPATDVLETPGMLENR